MILKTVNTFCPIHSQELKMKMAEDWFKELQKNGTNE